MNASKAQFTLGDTVNHILFNYRGVIVDVDPEFLGAEEWYQEIAKSKPPKDKPWYHVLVDGEEETTYVAERNLERDPTSLPIDHPLVEEFFSAFENGAYVPRMLAN